MVLKMRSTLLTTTLCFVNLRASTSRTWMDCIDPESLKKDGMPRVYPKEDIDDVHFSGPMISRNEELSIQGTTASLFEEVDPFRFTDSPSAAPSFPPSDYPTALPSISPSDFPSLSPTISLEPTRPPTKQPTRSPTSSPTFSVPKEPRNPDEGYFNYDDKSDYGPPQWHKVVSDGDFWHTFDLKDSGSNQCDDDKDQSPIDVCVHPRGNCKETHEMRPKVSNRFIMISYLWFLFSSVSNDSLKHCLYSLSHEVWRLQNEWRIHDQANFTQQTQNRHGASNRRRT